GINAEILPLVGDIGRNFLVIDEKGKNYIFKIANEIENYYHIKAQNDVLQYLNDQNFDFELPLVIKNKNGELITEIKDKSSKKYYSRLLTWIKGKFLAEVEINEELLEDYGRVLGLIDRALKDFYVPHAERYWHWDLKNILDLRELTSYITDRERKRLIEYFILQFETEVIPKFPKLRKSIIYNDANDYNVLVKIEKNGKKRIAGLIDFGDMVHSYTVFDIAIALTYAMLDKTDPLKVAYLILKGYNRVFPLEENEIKVLYYCIAGRLCLSLMMSAYQKKLRPEDKYIIISEKSVWKFLKRLHLINPFRAEEVFRHACSFDSRREELLPERIIELRRKYIGRSLRLHYREPLKIVKGALQYLYDDKGKTYLDCVNNVAHVGHSNPRVVRAVQKQMAILNTNTRYLYEYLIRYAERLAKKFPEPLKVVFLVNSGSEANELALRLAYTYTGKRDMIVIDHAYHGNTTSLIDLSPYKFDGPGGSGSGPYTHKVIMPDTFRGPYKSDDREAGVKYAKHVIMAIEKLKNKGKGLAGFIAESLLGCGGHIPLPEGYLKTVYKAVREAGGVCIADEVQVGFGRVGTHFWAFEKQGVIPDIVTLGKPIGNGHPLAAVITTSEIADAFDNGMEYFNTFGGNPVSCAAGMAVLEVIEDENLQENALKVGNKIMEGFRELQKKYPIIGDVRGSGLFIGVEFVKDPETIEPAPEIAEEVVERMKEEGVLLNTEGPYHNVIKIKPPIIFTEENADQLINTIEKVLKLIF
ncbi:aminotransferase class III-fold pyridoxal phosphate-dependent enzyme, partial [Candidatus Aminicenantes bacterium AC-334-E05]|nr:aminotransferase class III-fold pyridoxal phosphate-dependent enzyme [Candidatus Aminicenantes bacterium AC-334-E05]